MNTTFSYEFPHDQYHTVMAEEIAPFTYVVHILGVPVVLETTPSQTAFSAAFPHGEAAQWSCGGDSDNDVLQRTHVAVLEYVHNTHANPLMLKIGGVERPFVLSQERYSVSWVCNYANFRVFLYQMPDAYSVSADHNLKGRAKIWAEGDGETPQEAVDAWEVKFREEMRARQEVVDDSRVLLADPK